MQILPVFERIILNNRKESAINAEKSSESGLHKVVDIYIPKTILEAVTDTLGEGWKLTYPKIISLDRNNTVTVYLVKFVKEGEFLNFVIKYNRRTKTTENVFFTEREAESVCILGPEETEIAVSTADGAVLYFDSVSEPKNIFLKGRNEVFSSRDNASLQVIMPQTTLSRVVEGNILLMEGLKLGGDNNYFLVGTQNGEINLFKAENKEIKLVKTVSLTSLSANKSVNAVKVVQNKSEMAVIYCFCSIGLIELKMDPVSERIRVIDYPNSELVTAFDVSDQGLAAVCDSEGRIEFHLKKAV